MGTPYDFIIDNLPAAAPGVAAIGLSLYNWYLMRRGAKLNLDKFVTYGVYSPEISDAPPKTIFYFPILVNNTGYKPGMISEVSIVCTGPGGKKNLKINRRIEIHKEGDPSVYTSSDFREAIPQFPFSVPSHEGIMFLLECTDIYHDVLPPDEDITFQINIKYGKNKSASIEFPLKVSSIDLKLAKKNVKWISAYTVAFDPNSDQYLLKQLLTEVGLEKHYETILNDAYFDPAVQFGGMKIAILKLNNYTIRKLPDLIGQFSELRELHLMDTNIEHIPGTIGNLKKLRILDINKNLLSKVPDSIGALSELQILRLDKNQLTSLPESIGHLRNLKELYIYNNQLSRLPESLGSLSNLISLHTDQNSLKELPNSLYSLKTLRNLWLSNNDLSTITTDISNLNNLENLSLSDNAQLSELPSTIGDLSSLKGLDIRGTTIHALPESLFNIRSDVFFGYNHNNFPPEVVERVKNWGTALEKQGFQIRIANMALSRP
jgi:Leucine-rich repeat (LRR) protein